MHQIIRVCIYKHILIYCVSIWGRAINSLAPPAAGGEFYPLAGAGTQAIRASLTNAFIKAETIWLHPHGLKRPADPVLIKLLPLRFGNHGAHLGVALEPYLAPHLGGWDHI